ncbi:MAG: glycosyl hydrolase 115 family protein [Clostridium sp.]|nr:glycosyl hydrolase 115 family protein [Clostridium sp.]
MNLKAYTITLALAASVSPAFALDHPGITTEQGGAEHFQLIADGKPAPILISDADEKGISIAASNLAADFERVSGTRAEIINSAAGAKRAIIAGTKKNPIIAQLMKEGKISASELVGKREKYVMATIESPFEGADEALVIAGSDRRGAIYGIYELSEQIGVSPWHDWADVPAQRHDNLWLAKGAYTAGEPAVEYRGIFLNDEAPCLTGWVKNTYGTSYGDHNFYGRVCELILRLRGNFLWPAMWNWAFYADDPENSKTADEMGVVVSTSHHEPMARNHQEWARHRNEYGKWNYATNQKTLDKFFTEGIQRMKGTEDIVTIGMRGDGDEAMSESADVKLLDKVIKNQRKIIEKNTGRPAKETPQVWALYKEVLDYYDKGLRAPADVTYLLCDDNWGNVRRLPNEEERKHPGGWGMYYHVDYVGAPRNSKLINVTPIQNMWEQMNLTYDYGVDKLWVLNVGDLKPMEYPITLFLSLAWDPKKYPVDNITGHALDFCNQQFGESQGAEAARILNLYSKYAGRVTPEMLDQNTYNINTGEWEKATSDFMRLEAEALRQYNSLAPEYRDAYNQLILFPVQLMANLYDMYYAVAMNHKLHSEGNPMANAWAERAEKAFARDGELMRSYNQDIAGGKWNGMMTQKHIGYTSWNDTFEKDTMPEVYRFENPSEMTGNYTFDPEKTGAVAIEAEHYNTAIAPEGMQWTVYPDMGRTLSGIALTPYTRPCGEAKLNYRMRLPAEAKNADVHVAVKSTLAFKRPEGHRYAVSIDGGEEKIVNFNGNLNEEPQNIYDVYYPTVARRVVESIVNLKIPASADGFHTLSIRPIDEGIVFEKIVVDCGGYEPSYLYGNESKSTRKND